MIVKVNGQLFVAFLMMDCLVAKADVSAFGNNPDDNGTGFSIVTYNQLSLSGGAVEFTPSANIDVSSVTLWLSGYDGEFGQSISAGIWLDDRGTPSEPFLNLDSPVHNDGSLAAFSFSNPAGSPFYDPSGSTILYADTPYWLIVTSASQPGLNETVATWVGGDQPKGQGNYNCSDSYNIYSGTFSSSSSLPAFTINVVPEPPTAGLLLAGSALYFFLRRRFQMSPLNGH